MVLVVLEMILFFSLQNVAACGMTLLCWSIYRSVGLKEWVVTKHLFPWLVFTSMSLYRILPLFATLCEYKPITYRFEMPYETILWESILYVVSALAFYFAVYRTDESPNLLKRILIKLQFYDEPSDMLIWAIGLFGFGVNIFLLFSVGDIEIGDVVGKFLAGFGYLNVAPILLMFPSLYKRDSDILFSRSNLALLYFVTLIIVSFATNSRQAMLLPIGTFVILFFLSIIKTKSDYKKIISLKGIFIAFVVMVFALPAITDISDAMIATRAFRGVVDRSQLLEQTWKMYNDKEQLKRFREAKDQIRGVDSYAEGWTEEYVDNFALNRYCNMRITDITLYHAQRVGYADKRMQHAFWDRMLALLPMPILNFLGLKVNKVDIYSRGDLLYSLSRNSNLEVGLRVTSHVADGLVTFGYCYFLLQFVLFYIQFILLDCFQINCGRKTIYSTLGLISIFSFLAMFRNANGALGEMQYIVRGFVQSLFMYLLCFKIISTFISNKNGKRLRC